jgi:putative ABC transport system permease protein
MFFRLLLESFVRQRRRKLLAGIAILLGTTAVTAMLALATTIGDRIHRELAVYGANIVVTPKADTLDVRVGGLDLKPATGGAYLKESDLEKLHGIFWANSIIGVSPELSLRADVVPQMDLDRFPSTEYQAVGLRFSDSKSALALHPFWKVEGTWPTTPGTMVVGAKLAAKIGKWRLAQPFVLTADDMFTKPHTIGANDAKFRVVGIASTGSDIDNDLILSLPDAQNLAGSPSAISRVEISARTRPEDAFARQDPDQLSPAKRDIWYCRPYANSIAYQIQEAIPGSRAEQVRRVEQSEGTVLERISGLMWLISGAALLAAGFAVSAAMATAVLERRGEIGIMRSLGASKAAIASLFYAESGLLAVITGSLGYLAGSALAWALGKHIFPTDGAAPLLNLVLLPVVVALALLVAIAGSTPSIRAALNADPATTLRSDA